MCLKENHLCLTSDSWCKNYGVQAVVCYKSDCFRDIEFIRLEANTVLYSTRGAVLCKEIL